MAMIPLRNALRLDASPQVAFVGAGGKTTAMLTLARQFERPVLVTTSTHLSLDQVKLGDRHIVVETPRDLRKLTPLGLPAVTVLSGRETTNQRVTSLSSEALAELSAFARQHDLPLLVEADGARQLPLKTPAEHEPAIPPFVETVIVVAGLSALGRPLQGDVVHRPEHFAKVTGLTLGDVITSGIIAKALIHFNGGLKNIPPTARRIALLNQADSQYLQASARGIADRLLPVFESVLVAELKSSSEVVAVHERIAGIILAAGGSERLGQPKQLLDWHGKTFVRQVAETAIAAGLAPVIVVTGANAEKTEAAVQGLPVQVVHNPAWQAGQSSSVKTGLSALAGTVGGGLFMVVDQPQLPSALIAALRDEHANTLAPIVAPLVDGHRSNPVLFDRATFADLTNIEGDVGGRAIFSKYQVSWVPWLDVTLAIDVDTIEDYKKLLRQAG